MRGHLKYQKESKMLVVILDQEKELLIVMIQL